MKIDTDTMVSTQVRCLKNAVDEIDTLVGCRGFSENMEIFLTELEKAIKDFEEAWVESRRKRRNL
jgi:hypothetical protein